jgi:prepilin-type N-terminal cleavage/methylation domain-containing protein
MKLPVKLNKTGFTLIELLVVIAVLGILASVVLVAINPAERINEANDSGVQSDVSQVATAVEACFTQKATGYYDDCNTPTELTGGGFLKNAPSVTIGPATGTSIADLVIYGALAATSATCDTGTGAPKYYAYYTSTGSTEVFCGGTPSP